MNYSLTGINDKEKILLYEGKLLPVMEDFFTIQGEGFNSGKAAYFIRIGGCDVGCHWCDVKESWDANLHPLVNTDDIVKKVLNSGAKSVVVTGGEPLQYNLNYLTQKLKDNKIETFIETSGAFELTGNWDWICLSPKKTSPPLPIVYSKANELKIIVFNHHDFIWAQDRAAKVSENCHLYLQPEWSKRDEITPAIVDFVKQHPRWMISLQTHKYINIP